MRKSYLRYAIVVATYIISVLACGGSPAPEPQPAAPTQKPSSNTSPTKAPAIVSTNTERPPEIVTKNPTATKKSSPIPPSDTPLPPIPDFDELVTFGVGGGGGQCPGLDQEPNFINMSQHDQAITTCFWLSGFDFAQPFQIVLSQANGSGNRLITPNLYLDSRNDVVQWDGYSELPGSGHWGRKSSGILAVYNFNVWSPDRLSPGQWRFTISQKGSAFYEYTSDFWVDKDDRRPYITVLNEQINELLPFDGGMWVRSISPKSNGKLDVRGVDFPPNTPIYILLYSSGLPRNNADMRLVSKQVTQSNNSGSISAELSGPFKQGQIYLVVGISDPNTTLTAGFQSFDENLPFDRFEVTYPTSNSPTSSSCPGAPPQRMFLNQRGYVCTKSDDVRLRDAPYRSANTINYLPVGSQFTVLDGPSCADNWSWWQIRTDFGTTGWIAEGGDQVDPYFICPLP